MAHSSRGTAGYDSLVTLSAAASSDTAQLQSTTSMRFEWSCISMVRADGTNLRECLTAEGALVKLMGNKALTLTFTPRKLRLQRDAEYEFSVNVSAPPPLRCYPTRTDAATVIVEVLAAQVVPALKATVCNSCPCDCSAPAPRSLNPGQFICLTTSCTKQPVSTRDARIVSQQWKLDSRSHGRSSLDKAMVRVWLDQAPAGLKFQGEPYVFQVLAKFGNSASNHATVSFLPNRVRHA